MFNFKIFYSSNRNPLIDLVRVVIPGFLRIGSACLSESFPKRTRATNYNMKSFNTNVTVSNFKDRKSA